MKTITPFELQMLIDKCEVELIDVRPAKEFKEAHAQVARSIPLSRFDAHSILAHRQLDRRAPVYLMSQGRMLASLAACSLARAGLAEPVIVEGGIEGWEGQCLPMGRNQPWRLPEMIVSIRMAPARFAAGLCLVRHGFALLAAFLASAVVAIPRAFDFGRRRSQHSAETSSWREYPSAPDAIRGT